MLREGCSACWILLPREISEGLLVPVENSSAKPLLVRRCRGKRRGTCAQRSCGSGSNLFQRWNGLTYSENVLQSTSSVIDIQPSRIIEPMPLRVLKERVCEIRAPRSLESVPTHPEHLPHVKEVAFNAPIGHRGELLPEKFRRRHDGERPVLGCE
jgi:hypothetical protein